jgi:hypothetical protein
VTLTLLVASELAGLIWTIQVVQIRCSRWSAPGPEPHYGAEHRPRITWLVAPLMVVNVGPSVALLAARPSSLRVVNAALAAGVCVATGLVYGPMQATRDARGHRRDPSPGARQRARTAAWTAQAIVAIACSDLTMRVRRLPKVPSPSTRSTFRRRRLAGASVHPSRRRRVCLLTEAWSESADGRRRRSSSRAKRLQHLRRGHDAHDASSVARRGPTLAQARNGE